jgi:predicted ATPase
MYSDSAFRFANFCLWPSQRLLLDDGLADESVLQRGEVGSAGWCAPELLRVRAERVRGTGDVESAANWFRRGIELARSQQALAWELRCATGLARLLRTAGSKADAHAALAPVVRRFTQGFGASDVREATRLLEQLR